MSEMWNKEQMEKLRQNPLVNARVDIQPPCRHEAEIQSLLSEVSRLQKELSEARELLRRVDDAITFPDEESAKKSHYGLPPDVAHDVARFLAPRSHWNQRGKA